MGSSIGHGTALLNESAGEGLHTDFDAHYKGYIVKDLNASSYANKAGYTATPVACRWAGAVFEVTQSFG